MRPRYAIFMFSGIAAIAAAGVAVARHAPAPLPATRPSAAAAATPAAPATRPVVDLRPTLVTLSHQKADPEVVIADIRQQTGYSVSLYESARHMTLMKPVTIEMHQQPFWAAVRDVCAQADLAPSSYGYAAASGLVLATALGVGSAPMKCPTSLDGPFMTAITGIQRHHIVDMAAPTEVRRTLTVSFTVYAEPKARLIQVPYYAQINEAVDERGVSLLADGRSPPAPPAVAVRGWWFTVTANLPCPQGSGARIARLRGGARCLAGVSEAAAAELVIPFSFENVPLP